MAPAFKRRKIEKTTQPDTLAFDLSARHEYLTGFHKRKQARIQSAREAAVKREKEEKVRERKQLREQRKQDLEQHVAAVNEEVRKQNALFDEGAGASGADQDDDDDDNDDNDEIFAGFAEAQPVEQEITQQQLPSDEEYIDEDKYTTVTVEAMGGEEGEAEGHSDAKYEEAQSAAAEAKKPPEKLENKKKARPYGAKKDGDGEEKTRKVKKKKFRYESKAERAMTRKKQKAKNHSSAKARREAR